MYITVKAISGMAIRFKKKGIFSIYKYFMSSFKNKIIMDIYLNIIAIRIKKVIIFTLAGKNLIHISP
jgi:hypothetical protein